MKITLKILSRKHHNDVFYEINHFINNLNRKSQANLILGNN